MGLLSFFAPDLALKRFIAAERLALLKDTGKKRNYEAGQESRFRTHITDGGLSADDVVGRSVERIRAKARYFDENHDLAIGVLNDLVNGIVGDKGIVSIPLSRLKDGSPAKKLNKVLRSKLKDFFKSPEVSDEYSWATAQQMICRSALRDGDTSIQHHFLKSGGEYSYAFEIVPSDLIPHITDKVRGLDEAGFSLGVKKDKFGKVTDYAIGLYDSYKTVKSSKVSMYKIVSRVGQSRGMSILAPVLGRLDDIKDVEESELIAARIAACLTAVIVRDKEDSGVGSSNGLDKSFQMSPGLVYDGLEKGESVSILESKRPNPDIDKYRLSQLRAIAAGTGASASNISRMYLGSYSSQRQEAVHQDANYRRMRAHFVKSIVLPVYNNIILFLTMNDDDVMAVLKDVDLDTLYNADHIGPVMPVVDQIKASRSALDLVKGGVKSWSSTVLDLGGYPDDVLDKIEEERSEMEAKKLTIPTAHVGNEVAK